MDPLHLAHLIFICLWSGVALAEFVIELSAKSDEEIRYAAIYHRRIDLIIEIPLLICILATGALLVCSAWPLTPLHYVKIGAALLAMGANFVCIPLVFLRHRALDDATRCRALHGHILKTGIGIPFFAVAAYLGFAYFTR